MTTVAVPATSTTTEPLRRAGFASRLIADGIDFVIVELVFALVLLGIALGRFLLTKEPFKLPDPGVGVVSGGQFLLLVAYLAWGWSSTGRTPGKAVLGLRVVTAGGQPLGVPRAIGRAVVCALVPLVLAWSLVSRRNAGIHDLLLATAVVYDWRPRQQKRQPQPASP